MTKADIERRAAALQTFITYRAPLLSNRMQSIIFLSRQLERHLEGDELAQAREIIENVEALKANFCQEINSLNKSQET